MVDSIPRIGSGSAASGDGRSYLCMRAEAWRQTFLLWWPLFVWDGTVDRVRQAGREGSRGR